MGPQPTHYGSALLPLLSSLPLARGREDEEEEEEEEEEETTRRPTEIVYFPVMERCSSHGDPRSLLN